VLNHEQVVAAADHSVTQTDATAAAAVAELADVMTTPSSEPPPGKDETGEDRAKVAAVLAKPHRASESTGDDADRKPAAMKRNKRVAHLETVAAAAATDVTPCCDNEWQDHVAEVEKTRLGPEREQQQQQWQQQQEQQQLSTLKEQEQEENKRLHP
jgi:hypothetical protein